MRQTLKPWKKPKLYNAKGNLKERWFVYYYYIHPNTGKYQRIRVYQDLNNFKTKSERTDYANELIRGITEDLEAGYNPFQLQNEQQLTGLDNLQQAVPVYLAHVKRTLGPKTHTGYKSTIGALLAWAEKTSLHLKPFKLLKAADVQKYFDYSLETKGWAASTFNSELTVTRAFFTWLVDKEVISFNPAKRVKRLRETVNSHTAYNDELIQKVTDYLKQSDTPTHKQLYQFVQFLYYTCLRPKELRSLKVGDIRLATATILVGGDRAKGKRSEPVDISPGLEELIRQMDLIGKPADWYVFGNAGKGVPGNYFVPGPGPKPVGVNHFSDLYRDIMDELKVAKEYTLYGWKHTRNVHLWMETKDLMRIMRHNRHTDPKVTMRYLRSLGLLIDTRLKDERRI
ncbi:hypothetical protein DYU11_22525 [Fibrisoma montanum]|uniref:Site-specific integrase n=1 Tax=Fibrisoma montanum TaxID=2305895 RepID=A0A418M226_9BACT|nr:tyrosine-type recombinase/integrase [Fibrisoma montanum]RIV19707.1 hypothetical protein DYU11_22525 [Fibrisoma montanum]